MVTFRRIGSARGGSESGPCAQQLSGPVEFMLRSMREDARILAATLFPTTKPIGDRAECGLMRLKEEKATDLSAPRLGFEAPTEFGRALPVVVRP